MNNLNSWYTYQTNKDAGKFTTGEVNSLPSLTVPNMTIDLSDMLERYATGRSITIIPASFDEEGHRMPDLSKMDKLEVEMLKQENLKNILQKKAILEQLEKAKTKAEMKSQIKAELEEVRKKEDLLKQQSEAKNPLVEG